MYKIISILIITVFSLFLYSSAVGFEYGYTVEGFKYVKHDHNETSYRHEWCSAHNGIEEYENDDYTRVDCLTQTHAVEFDFANKWAESIGQALHYAYKTGKKGMVVLILENSKEEEIYYKRVKILGEIYDFDVEYITHKILNLKDGICPYSDCKCHRKKYFNN